MSTKRAALVATLLIGVVIGLFVIMFGFLEGVTMWALYVHEQGWSKWVAILPVVGITLGGLWTYVFIKEKNK